MFTSEIKGALTAIPDAGNQLEIVNAPGLRRAPGAEALVGYVFGSLHAIASWSYLNVTEEETPGERQDVPLVPRQSGELGAILESEKRGRIGLEVGYTGRQAVEFDPYRTFAPGYFELNALGELRWVRWRFSQRHQSHQRPADALRSFAAADAGAGWESAYG